MIWVYFGNRTAEPYLLQSEPVDLSKATPFTPFYDSNTTTLSNILSPIAIKLSRPVDSETSSSTRIEQKYIPVVDPSMPCNFSLVLPQRSISPTSLTTSSDAASSANLNQVCVETFTNQQRVCTSSVERVSASSQLPANFGSVAEHMICTDNCDNRQQTVIAGSAVLTTVSASTDFLSECTMEECTMEDHRFRRMEPRMSSSVAALLPSDIADDTSICSIEQSESYCTSNQKLVDTVVRTSVGTYYSTGVNATLAPIDSKHNLKDSNSALGSSITSESGIKRMSQLQTAIPLESKKSKDSESFPSEGMHLYSHLRINFKDIENVHACTHASALHPAYPFLCKMCW